MNIVMRNVAELIPADYNPRQISTSQFEKLRASIREFGFAEPVVVNRHQDRMDIIVGGHMRVEAAKAEGYLSVPCVYVELDEQREKLLNLALNRIHGDWDQDKLTELVVTLSQEGAPLALSGFEDAEIVRLVDQSPLSGVPDSEQGDDDTEPGMVKIELSYAADTMTEFMGILRRWEGETESDRVLAMARYAEKSMTSQ